MLGLGWCVVFGNWVLVGFWCGGWCWLVILVWLLVCCWLWSWKLYGWGWLWYVVVIYCVVLVIIGCVLACWVVVVGVWEFNLVVYWFLLLVGIVKGWFSWWSVLDDSYCYVVSFGGVGWLCVLWVVWWCLVWVWFVVWLEVGWD